MEKKYIFDHNKLEAFYGDDIDIIFKVYEEFKDSFSTYRDNIIEAKNQNDFNKLEIRAHTLKGIFRNFFVSKITNILQEVEDLASKGQNTDFENSMKTCLEYSEIFFKDFDNYLKSFNK